MSVTTTGVKGYEYQYKATVLIGLLYLSNATKLFVEKKGIEDATITIGDLAGDRVVEAQIKNSSRPVDINVLAKWLCHFQEKSSTENLLSRITNTTNTALIITSARCQDKTAFFAKSPPEIKEHDNMNLDKQWIDSFADALSNNEYTGDTTLQKDRNRFCKDQAESLTKSTTIRDALSRIIIWEKITHDQLDQTVERILNKEYKIAQSLTNGIFLQLLEVVKKGRDGGIDILPLLKQILSTNKGDAPQVDLHYQSRVEETSLITELQMSGLLLLTGRTQCGKSELAKKLANHFYEQGYSYRICSDANVVDSFFNLNSMEDKVCILEDPWGHIEPISDSFDQLRKLELLIKNKRENHKLIITTREEVLQALGMGERHEKKIGGKVWINITVTDRNTLKYFWQLFSKEKGINKEIIGEIEEELNKSSENSLLQIGELQYLAKYDQDLSGKNLQDLVHIARQTSTELAADLLSKREKAAELLSIISCCSDPITSISISDLCYILSDDDTEYSIRHDAFFTSGGSIGADPFPKYKDNCLISLEWQQELEYLERRGLIIMRGEQVLISHPNYFEGGKTLLVSNSSIRQTRILKYFRKAISCIAPQNATQAIKILNYIAVHVAPGQTDEVMNLAFVGRKSIFPSVKDQSLIFLVNNVHRLGVDMKEELEKTLDSSDTPSSHIFWHDNIPYISSHSSDFFGDSFYELPKDDFIFIKEKLNTDQSVSSFEAWKYVRTLENDRHLTFSAKEASYLMRYDELFIRKKVASIIISRTPSTLNVDLINIVFSDQHPSVVFTAIRTILINWRKFQPADKLNLKVLLKSSLKIEAIAIRSNQFLTSFDKEIASDNGEWEGYTEGEKHELWNLWGELYVIFVNGLPADLFLDPGQFGETTNTAFKYLAKENGMAVLYAWYYRIDHKIKCSLLLDEYEMAIADILLQFTDGDATIRADLIQKLLNYNDTNFIISSVKWIIYHWENLSLEEKNVIIDLIRSRRKDVRWIKAIVLTRHKIPPAEIQTELLGEPDIFNSSPEYFITKINSQLLEDCLKVYFGHPQPLWWLATQYGNVEFWQKIVKYILTNDSEPFFSICLRGLTSYCLNSLSGPWKDGLGIWETVCKKTTKKRDLADRLIYDISRINCSLDNAKKMFSALINSFQEEGKEEELVDVVKDNMEMLHQTGHGAEDLIQIIEHDFLTKVLSKLHPDHVLYIGVLSLKDGNNRDSFLSLLKTINETGKSIRFRPIKALIKRKLKEMSLLDYFAEEIDKIRDDIDIIGQKKLDAIKEIDEYKLPDWIGIN